MKKIFAIALTAILAASMGSAAFATRYTDINGFTGSYTMRDMMDVNYKSDYNEETRTYELPDAVGYSVNVSHSVPLYRYFFDPKASMGGDSESNTYYILDKAALMSALGVAEGTFIKGPSTYQGWIGYMLTNEAIAEELFGDDAFGAWVAAALGEDAEVNIACEIDDDTGAYVFGEEDAPFDWAVVAEYLKQMGFLTAGSETDALLVQPKTVAGTETKPGAKPAVLTDRDVQDNRISVRTIVHSDARGTLIAPSIGDGEISWGTGRLHFANTYASNPSGAYSANPASYSFDMYMIVWNKHETDKGVSVFQNVANNSFPVYDYMDWIDMSAGNNNANQDRGQVAVAIDFNQDISCYIGRGVTLHTKFFSGKKYYAVATRTADAATDRVLKQWKDVDNVLRIRYEGLNNSDVLMSFSNDYAHYFIYDGSDPENPVYLGKGNQKIPFASTLFLANKELDIEEDEDGEPADGGDEVGSAPGTGGNGSYNSNANLNPGTGR